LSELALRVLFAVIAAPAALGIIYLGGAPLAILLAVASALGAWEFYRIARAAGHLPMDWLGIAGAALIPLVVHAQHAGVVRVPVSAAIVAVIVVLGVTIWVRGVEGKPLGAAALTTFGILYTGCALSFGFALRYLEYAIDAKAGTALVALPLILTWASDIGAYFVGRAIGGRKLIPKVSPGKTVAGAVGGLVATVIVSVLLARFTLPSVASLALTTMGAILFGVIVSVTAQIGDLAESLLKREAGVKDSSKLLPGHGGILDRFDSLLFVLPVSYLVLPLLLVPAFR
jgi:phosphatidate cytidylyltransferase